MFRGNSNGVENRFHSAANIPAQSENKPYSLGRSLAKEKNRVKAIADKMSRDTEKIRYKSGGDIDRTVYPYTSLPFGDYSFEDDINNMNSGRS